MKLGFIPTTLAAVLLTLCAALATQAQTNRTFVAMTGTDAGNCAQTAPCKTYAFAHGVTNAGGEIVALDSSGFGTLTITKPITITALPSHYGFIRAQSNGAGITVNVGASDVVILRNLYIGGLGNTNTTGVSITSGRVQIENCTFNQLTKGVSVANASGKVTIEGSTFTGNATGLHVSAGKVTAMNSKFTFNSARAVHALTAGLINLQNCVITNNEVGVTADGFGGCYTVNPQVGPTVIVRLDFGAVLDNNIGFEMLNTGSPCMNSGISHGQNIFIRMMSNSASLMSTNIAGNSTFLSVSGISSGGYVNIGQYYDPYAALVP